ncbi:MAG: cytochrome c [Sedimenticola sp.]|nr:cytochrome c [Sedimenticola sp.]
MMTTSRIIKLLTRIAGFILLASGMAVIADSKMDNMKIGQLEFQKNCASCHGMSGEGDGPFVEFLKNSPPDLTLLSKRNGGIFPQQKVYDWIKDEKRIRAHGTQEMPIWGDRYSEELIEKYGYYNTGPKSSVKQRILELVFFLGGIQK